jgi:hypothetical protein
MKSRLGLTSVLGFIVFILMTTLGVATSKDTSTEADFGPLSKINEYQIIPLFLIDKTSDKEILLDHLVELLGKLGTVDISTYCIDNIPASSVGMLISLGGLEQAKTGSINIFADAEIVINKHKASCEAWKTFYHDPTLPYPIDEKDGLAFKKDPSAESPDLKVVITQMIEQFAEQYRQDNPGSKPTFHVDSKMFSASPICNLE